MAAEIFCRRVNNEIGAEIERSLQNRRPGVVANGDRARLAHNFRYRRKIDNFQQRIGRRFHPSQFRLRSHRFLHVIEIAHVDKIRFQTPTEEKRSQQSRRSVIRVDVREDMISRRKRLKKSHRGSRACAERRGCFAAFDRTDTALQRLAIRIVVARVHEPARVTSFHVALKCGGEMNGRGDGSGRRIDCVSGMHGQGFNFHVDLIWRSNMSENPAPRQRIAFDGWI